MHRSDTGEDSSAHPQSLFLTTRWSVVLAAKDKSSPRSEEALEILCQTYWYPLYAFVRNSGYAPHDAQDLTQGFFAALLEKDYLRVVEPEKGRFRAFLRVALKRFLGHQWERRRAEKRGGGRTQVSFDSAMAEQRLQSEQGKELGPDQLYDRRWALALLEEANLRLERDYEDRRPELEVLKPHLTAERGQIPYGEIASALNISEGAARVAVHRFRKRFREVFRDVIADTVGSPAELEDELRHVLTVLAGC